MAVYLRTKVLKNGDKSYYLDFYHNNKRWTESLKIRHVKGGSKNKENKHLAEVIRANRELELNAKGTQIIPEHRKKVELQTYFENYIASYHKKDDRMVKGALRWFITFLEQQPHKKPYRLADLSQGDCEAFKSFLTSSHLTGETPHNFFARFKKVLRQAVSDGFLYESPAEKVSIKRTNNALKKEILNQEELTILNNTPCGNDEVKRSFLFSCFTGLGLAECQKLKWSHIKNDKVKILRSKLADKDIYINNHLSTSAKNLLAQQPKGKNEDLVFNLSSKHKHGLISHNAVNKAIKNWVKRAEIDKKITFYSARHSFAVLLLNNKANLKTVADCMGHTSTVHTIKYLNYVENLQEEAIKNLPSL